MKTATRPEVRVVQVSAWYRYAEEGGAIFASLITGPFPPVEMNGRVYPTAEQAVAAFEALVRARRRR